MTVPYGDGSGPQLALRRLRGQQLWRAYLHEHLTLEGEWIALTQELVGVAGVAVTAAEGAAVVGIDGPAVRHAIGVAAVENAPSRELRVLDHAVLREITAD